MSFVARLLVFGLCFVVCSTYVEGNCESTLSAFPPNPETKCCGIQAYSSERLVGGTAAGIDQFPWVVIIEYLNKENVTKTAGCHGALISSQYVVTAAHCIASAHSFGTPTNIILGEYDTTHDGPDCEPVQYDGEDCTNGAIKIPIEATIQHPEFKKRPIINDIALIKLKSAAPYTDFIRPICLPTEDVTQKTGEFSLTESSWGSLEVDQSMNHKKQFVNLPLFPSNECEAAFMNKFKMDKSRLCAGGHGVKAFCSANSGGPLMYEKSNTFELVGLTSLGFRPCNLDIPVVYTNVYEFVPWIKSTISA